MPVDTVEIYRQLSRDLHDIYPEVCHRRLHVILALDTSGSMQRSTLLEHFYTIWGLLLDHFFKPGDRFTLIPFHRHPLLSPDPNAPSPASRSYVEDKGALGELKGWFTDARYLAVKQRGTMLFQAQRAALKRAQELAVEDKDSAVLVLVVSDQETTNWYNPEDDAREQRAKEEIDRLKEGFRSEAKGRASSGGIAHVQYLVPLSGGKMGKLVVFHAIEADLSSKPTVTMHRQLYVKEPGLVPVPPPPPPDPRPGWLTWSVLCLFLGILCLGFLRFKVTVQASGINAQGDSEKSLSAYQPVLVSACDAADTPSSHQLWLPLPNSTRKPQQLISIKGLWPGKCVVEKKGGVMQREVGGTANRVEINYGQGETVRVGLRQNESVLLQIVPAPWREGKLTSLTLAGFCFAVALILFINASAWQLPPPQPAIVPPDVVSLCQ